ncbi:MAG: hypothetical protein QGH58_01765 [Arenicellales bacterium]|nr:hypothetical protein [Arenicellales bacterium]MDP6790614.1 hypothetical protein [Arenicellales bacterium]MDP6919208.1 hypothetical protein [Arenicellales bacterium]|tara:strand:+ start:280 stop:420 length:141 start_codon:yes stop_codon:yes gene_type:complete
MLTRVRVDHPKAWTTDSVRAKADIADTLRHAERAWLNQILHAVKAR